MVRSYLRTIISVCAHNLNSKKVTVYIYLSIQIIQGPLFYDSGSENLSSDFSNKTAINISLICHKFLVLISFIVFNITLPAKVSSFSALVELSNSMR